MTFNLPIALSAIVLGAVISNVDVPTVGLIATGLVIVGYIPVLFLAHLVGILLAPSYNRTWRANFRWHFRSLEFTLDTRLDHKVQALIECWVRLPDGRELTPQGWPMLTRLGIGWVYPDNFRTHEPLPPISGVWLVSWQQSDRGKWRELIRERYSIQVP